MTFGFARYLVRGLAIANLYRRIVHGTLVFLDVEIVRDNSTRGYNKTVISLLTNFGNAELNHFEVEFSRIIPYGLL
jgi:hypothetical protein